MTSTIASQNQRKTFKKRLRKLSPQTQVRHSRAHRLVRLGRARVDVADAAHSPDPLGLAGPVAELLAQVAYVHVYAPVEDRQLAPQHRAHEVFARHNPTGGREKHDQNFVLDIRQLDRIARAPDDARARVNFNVADLHALRRARLLRRADARAATLDAAQDGVYARHKLARVERLRQVVVRADLKSDDAVNVLAAGGEHQHRD